MSELRHSLQQVGYRITPELEALVRVALRTRPCAGSFLTGPAGAGKTFLAEALAQVEQRDTFFFQAFPGCRKEELYQTILPDASQPSGFRTLEGVLPEAARASREGPTALILDEWDKTHPSTDAFLLDFLQTGRISMPGSRVRANLEHLTVFVTLNVERELSEPLLRRLPLIELKPPPAYLVYEALQDTHGPHPYVPAAVTLYQRSQLVNLAKPVTIQELRQLLDAIDELGGQADWNRLVFQFISKSWDDHELLKSAEDIPLGAQDALLERDRPALDPARYEPAAHSGETAPPLVPHMPRVQREWLERLPGRPLEAASEEIYGVVPRSESGYDGVARALLSRNEPRETIEDPADLKFAQVGEGEIIVYSALDFERIEEWGMILKDGGELLLVAHHGGEISTGMLMEFKAGTMAHAADDPERCRIYSLTDGELLMRYREVRIRWTWDKLEVVTHELAPTKEFWDFLYGPRGAVTLNRQALAQAREPGGEDQEQPRSTNEQLREDYLFVLRDYRHLREWFALLINRNLRVWDRVTCNFDGQRVTGSQLPMAAFDPDNEAPQSKEEAESIAEFQALTQAAQDYYESHINQIESELKLFVARSGEFPPAVEDGGMFALHEIHSDLEQIRGEGLKLFMRKNVREA